MNFCQGVKKMKGKIFKNIHQRKEEHGSVLVIGILFLTSLLLLIMPFMLQISYDQRLSEKSYKAFAALSMAEAGAERAIWELNSGDILSWSGTSTLRTMNIASFLTSDGETMGSIDIRVEDPEGDTPVVQSTGKVPYIGAHTVDRSTRVELWKGDGSYYLFDYGVFGDEGINLSSNAQLEGNIGTNATHLGCIYLDANANVTGNASTGVESIPEDIIITKPVSFITGEKQALSKPQPMPSVVPPEDLPYRGEYSLEGGNQDIISESGVYTSFMLQSGSQVTITADVTLYITGEFTMTSNTQLEIADDVKVTVYLGGSFVQDSNSQINNLSMDPTSLVFLGTDTFNGDVLWNSNTAFWGAIYTPRANVIYDSSAEFYGSIVGKFVDFGSQSSFHYDEALGDLKIDTGSPGSTFIVKSWHEMFPPVGS
jgi:hypothetical protein